MNNSKKEHPVLPNGVATSEVLYEEIRRLKNRIADDTTILYSEQTINESNKAIIDGLEKEIHSLKATHNRDLESLQSKLQVAYDENDSLKSEIEAQKKVSFNQYKNIEALLSEIRILKESFSGGVGRWTDNDMRQLYYNGLHDYPNDCFEERFREYVELIESEIALQSQPTAGGVKEPFLMDQQQFQELSHDEKEEYRAQFKPQPSSDGGVKEEDDRPLNDKEIIEWYIMKVNHLKIALAHQETVLETKEEEITLLKSHR